MHVREIPPGAAHTAARALLELRPAYGTAEALATAAEAQRPAGYRIAGAFADPEAAEAVGAAGFRVVENLAWRRSLYVDDLVTLPEARGQGAATALLAWLDDEAARLGCAELHLDSGVQPERQAAHRRYFGHGMRISSYHFQKPVPPAA